MMDDRSDDKKKGRDIIFSTVGENKNARTHGRKRKDTSKYKNQKNKKEKGTERKNREEGRKIKRVDETEAETLEKKKMKNYNEVGK